jgi:hypothetical protein
MGSRTEIEREGEVEEGWEGRGREIVSKEGAKKGREREQGTRLGGRELSLSGDS